MVGFAIFRVVYTAVYGAIKQIHRRDQAPVPSRFLECVLVEFLPKVLDDTANTRSRLLQGSQPRGEERREGGREEEEEEEEEEEDEEEEETKHGSLL